MNQKQHNGPTVFVVDDDPAIRFAMQALMDSVNLGHEIFLKNRPGCASSNLGSSGMIVRASLWVTPWAFPVSSEDLGRLSLWF